MRKRMVWVGCGRHAQQMLFPQLTRLDVEIVGVCDLDLSAAESTARRYGIDFVCQNHADLFSLSGIDAIGIAAGPVQHRDISIAALERGWHVFMEKPCGASVQDALSIQCTAQANRRIVAVGFMKRYSTANRIAHNIVKGPGFGRIAGFLGEYMTAPAYFKVGENVDYSSFYLHHCIHYMDLVSYFVSPVDAVTVFRHELEPGKQLLHVHFDFVGGAIGTVLMGTIQSRGTPVERIQVMGDHQRVEVNGVIEVSHFRNPPFKADDPQATLADDVDTLTWKPNFTAAANEDFKGYHAMFKAFLAALDGQPSDMPTIADGVEAMKVLAAMIAAVETPGKKIAVSPNAGQNTGHNERGCSNE